MSPVSSAAAGRPRDSRGPSTIVQPWIVCRPGVYAPATALPVIQITARASRPSPACAIPGKPTPLPIAPDLTRNLTDALLHRRGMTAFPAPQPGRVSRSLSRAV